MKRIDVEIKGRVQGIGFRQMVKKFCVKLGIVGWIENREDGSVFLRAEGEENKLKELLKWVIAEPGVARIDSLRYVAGESENNLREFSVRSKKSFLREQGRNMINLGKSFFVREKIPEHVALIPDGNRRWAREQGLMASQGHIKAGSYANIRNLIKSAEKIGIKYLSIWGFSTENWKRDKDEIRIIFDLLLADVKKFMDDAEADKIKFRHIGRCDRLPDNLREEIKELEERTRKNKGICVLLCLDYGGRDEVIRTVNKILKSDFREVDEAKFSKFLDTEGIPEPDLIIRTSGERRLSGFLPWQSVYSELYFVDKYFPDFSGEDLILAVDEYKRRKRRFGA